MVYFRCFFCSKVPFLPAQCRIRTIHDHDQQQNCSNLYEIILSGVVSVGHTADAFFIIHKLHNLTFPFQCCRSSFGGLFFQQFVDWAGYFAVGLAVEKLLVISSKYLLVTLQNGRREKSQSKETQGNGFPLIYFILSTVFSPYAGRSS